MARPHIIVHKHNSQITLHTVRETIRSRATFLFYKVKVDTDAGTYFTANYDNTKHYECIPTEAKSLISIYYRVQIAFPQLSRQKYCSNGRLFMKLNTVSQEIQESEKR